jgi:SAM-dependent methyltransferase
LRETTPDGKHEVVAAQEARSIMSEASVRDRMSGGGDHVCPPWIAYMLLNPLRRWLENPEAVLEGHVRPGDLAVDVGCAMGYFTLPLARRVGREGRVIGVDLQPAMLEGVRKRASKHGLVDRLELRTCEPDAVGLDDVAGMVDVALIMHMVHEAPDAGALFRQLGGAMIPGGRVLFAEPLGHVSGPAFERSLAQAREAGFEVKERLPVRWGRGRLLRKIVAD